MRLNRTVPRSIAVLSAVVTLCSAPVFPQAVDVQGRIELVQAGGQKAHHGPGSVVLWLTPEPGVTRATVDELTPGHFRMEQKNKSFQPHMLVVPLGSTVEFPNLDPFFHNVFSQFNGKRFDLGLYEAGSTRTVHFDHEGVSYIFCNIHSQMAAIIVTMRTPYFALASGSGPVAIHNVPEGDYELHVWAEGADFKALEAASHRVHIGPSQKDVGAIQIHVTGVLTSHKNKFGEDYGPDPNPTY